MLHLQGVSMPRSGHHFLHRILKAAYGDAFGYCEFYIPWEHNSYAECCKAIPCAKASGFEIFMQKNHDFKHDYIYSRRAKYVIQIRHPVLRSLSNFNLYIHTRPDEANQEGFQQFCNREADYYCRFWKRWVAPRRRNTVVVRYEDLTQDTVASVTRMIEHFGLRVDQDRLAEAVAKESGFANVNHAPFRPRSVTDSPYYDADFMTDFAQRIARNCKGYDYPLMVD